MTTSLAQARHRRAGAAVSPPMKMHYFAPACAPSAPRLPRRLAPLALFFVFAAAAGAGEPAELSRLREQYDRQARNAMQPILQSYARELENLAGRLSLRRDADGARLAYDELATVKSRLAALGDAPLLASPRLVQRKVDEKNVVANPGLESGTVDGWFLFNTDVEKSRVERAERLAHAGHCCLRIRRDKAAADMAGALQDLAGRVKPGDRIRASAWVRTKPDIGPDRVLFAVALKESAGQKILQLVSKSAKGTGEWEQLSFDFIVPTRDQQPALGAIHLFVGISGKEDIGDVLIDDVYAGPAAE